MLDIFKRINTNHFHQENAYSKNEVLNVSTRRAQNEFMKASRLLASALSDDAPTYGSLYKAPLFIKLSFFLNCITGSIIREEDLDWGTINRVLSERIQYDYNIDVPEKFSSIEQLHELRTRIFMAINDLYPYYMDICKDCAQVYYLNYGELDSYIKKNLNVPKRCELCRKTKKY